MKNYVLKEQKDFKKIGASYLGSFEWEYSDRTVEVLMREELNTGTMLTQTAEGNVANISNLNPTGGIVPYYIAHERKISDYYQEIPQLSEADFQFLAHNTALAHQKEVELFPSYAKMQEFQYLLKNTDDAEQVENFVNTTPFMGMDGVTRDDALLDQDLDKLATQMRLKQLHSILGSMKDLVPANMRYNERLVREYKNAAIISDTDRKLLVQDARNQDFSSLITLKYTDAEYIQYILTINPNPSPTAFATAIARLRNFDLISEGLLKGKDNTFMITGKSEGKTSITLL